MKKNLIILLMLMSMVFTARSQEKIFGKYKKPPLLLKLEAYQKKHKKDMEALGFVISYNKILPYSPVDIIPFAQTTGRCQLGFLTDFSSIEDLADAPIILTQTCPDYGEWGPANILIAKDLRSYLMLTASIDEIYYQEMLDYLMSRKSFNDFYKDVNPDKDFIIERKKNLQEHYDSISAHIGKSKQNVKRLNILKEFGIDPVTDPVGMMKELIRWRNEMTTIKTFDDIGIVYKTSLSAPVRFDEVDLEDISAVKKFIANSSLPQRLKWYRYVLSYEDIYFLDKENRSDVKELIVQALKNDGYFREADALGSDYYLDSNFKGKKRWLKGHF